MKHRKGLQLLLLFVAVLLLCSGCWDKKEFNQLTMAQAIAVDYADGQYQLTLQLIMPKASEEDITNENLWIIDAKGHSVGEAMEAIALRAPREIYLDHLDIVLLGEGILKNDIDNGLEYLLKQNVLRRRTNLLAVEGTAGELLQAKPDLAEVDIFYLSNLIKDQNRRERKQNTIINDYYLKEGNELQEAMVIPRVEAKNEKELQLSGGALLRDGVLLRWVDADWMKDYRWSTGAQEIMTLAGVGPEQQDITLEIHKNKWDWELLSEHPLRVQANIKGDLYVVENNMLTKTISLEQIEAMNQHIQQQVQKQLRAQIEHTLKQAQQDGGDAFGLGRWLYAWHPDVVADKNWPELFAQTHIAVNLETELELFEYR